MATVIAGATHAEAERGIGLNPAAPHELLWALATAVVPARALHLVAQLGVADFIDDVPVTAGDLAPRCGTNPSSLERLMRLLASQGIFALDGGGFRHTDASRLLRSDHPMSMRAFASLLSLNVCWSGLGALDHAVRTSSSGVESFERTGFFGYLQAHPDEARAFGEAMTSKAQADIAAVLATYDFRPFRTIADIGGGHGHLLQAILAATPGVSGVLFDLPDVVAQVDTSERLRTQGGDFFVDPLPAADAYLLMEVIHDWPDAEAVKVLQAVRRAASAGATVLVIEDIVPDEGLDPRVQTLDVLMLAVTGGRERTGRQIAELLRQSGFRPTAVVSTGGSLRVAEAVAV